MKTCLTAAALLTQISATSAPPSFAAGFSDATSVRIDVDRTAPIISTKQIFIAATAAEVWAIHVNFDGWAMWQPDIKHMVAPARVAPGYDFHWGTEGLEEITSTILQVEPERRIVWGGTAQGLTAVHVWTIEAASGGVTLRTDETWSGEGFAAQAEMLKPLLDASLDRWLGAIRRKAELAR